MRQGCRGPGRAAVGLAVLIGACGTDPSPPVDAARSESQQAPAQYVELGDFDELQARGRLRFANVARAHLHELPRLRWGMPDEEHIVRELADRIGLDLEFDEYPTEAEAQSALLAGRVDVIVGRAAPGIVQPPEGIAHSRAFESTPGVVVGRTGETPDSLADLSGRTITFAASSGLIGVSAVLAEDHPGTVVDTIDVPTVVDVIDRILTGATDLTLAERWVAEAVVGAHPELELGAEYGEVHYGAAVRASNPDLLRLVDDFAFELQTAGEDGPEAFRDLAEIRARRVLRVLTVNGPSSYFLYKGRLVGFDLDLIHMFADEQDLIVQMVVAPSVDMLEPWLLEGLGDMVGAGILRSAIRDTAVVRVTREYHDVHPVLIAHGELGVDSLGGLAGHTVIAGRNNPYLPVLEQSAQSVGFTLRATTDAESTSQLLSRLERREADVTVLESHLAAAELPHFPTLTLVDSLPEVPGRSWAVRADQETLLEELNAFIDRKAGGLDHAVLIRKHFRPDTRLVAQPDLREDGILSPFDETMRRHAAGSGLDWRLLTAQMFQESRFDPEARSAAGAYGLMQMMPRTAQQMGVRDLEDPEEQVRAGVEYMRWLHDRFSPDLALGDRLAFTLAAYNAGYGHVADARLVAERTGLDPDRWFEGVELAMLSLADPDVYRSTRHGYVRGSEPVRYVRRIVELGQMYYRLAPEG